MKKSRLILIISALLILVVCIGITGYLLFFNSQNLRLFKQAQNNFLRDDDASLQLAESQLLQVVRSDSENEAAFVMLGEIARKRKIYPERVYYCHMAYRLNPLSSVNKQRYIESLCFARYFDRLETLLAQDSSLSYEYAQLLIYASGHNGSADKYKLRVDNSGKDNRLSELASLIFKHKHLSSEEKLSVLNEFNSDNDLFLQQEYFVALTEIHLAMQNIDKAEEALLRAYKLNEYAFAPALGRFYANYRNLGKALEVFEKHLSVYHDQSIAMECAEIYCLLNQPEKIAALQKSYQSDSGKRAMLCSYYFEALGALVRKDIRSLRELTLPLRKNINTPLSAFMFFCVDIQYSDLSAVYESYKALLAHRNYLNLQEQADNILLEYLKKSFGSIRTTSDELISLATLLYGRKKDIFIAKLILLAQKKSGAINPLLLADAVERFSKDQGVIKLAIEYYLVHDHIEAEKFIGLYKKNFTAKASDMLRYEINLNMRKGAVEKVSELFRSSFSQEILPEYWNFASSTMREIDLQFLSKDKLYAPYCNALLLLKNKNAAQACDILENAEAGNNHALQFFAAKILAENGRNQSALKKYGKIPESSPLRITVLMNMAELYAEAGNLDQALILSSRAYNAAPQMAETQLCHADKLHKKGRLSEIPNVIKLAASSSFRREMERLWIAGMQARIKECNINTQREKIRELCRQLLVISPDNDIALEYLKKIKKLQ